MNTTENSVKDKTKLTDEQIGKIYKKTNEMIRRINDGTISYDGVIASMQDTIEGKFVSIRKKHIIDCYSIPFIPDNWSIEEHRRGPKLEFYEDDNTLIKILEGDPILLNANILDYLLLHPEIIPWSLKGKRTYFNGTIYLDIYRCIRVRYLYMKDNKWCCDSEYANTNLLKELKSSYCD